MSETGSLVDILVKLWNTRIQSSTSVPAYDFNSCQESSEPKPAERVKPLKQRAKRIQTLSVSAHELWTNRR